MKKLIKNKILLFVGLIIVAYSNFTLADNIAIITPTKIESNASDNGKKYAFQIEWQNDTIDADKYYWVFIKDKGNVIWEQADGWLGGTKEALVEEITLPVSKKSSYPFKVFILALSGNDVDCIESGKGKCNNRSTLLDDIHGQEKIVSNICHVSRRNISAKTLNCNSTFF